MNLFPLRNFDWVIFLVMLILISFGVLMIYSTSFNENEILGNLYYRQIIYALIGILGFVFMARFDYKFFAHISSFLYIAAIILLVLTFAWGITTRGSTRWIDLGWVRLQPSEFIKPVLISVLAFYYSSRGKITLKDFIVTFVLAAIPAALVFRQPDLGNALIIIALWFVISVVAGVPWKYILSLLGGALLIGPASWNFLQEYQRQRLTTFINPQLDPLGAGYNIIQAIIAVGSGQLLGQGFGRGTQSHLNFLPEHHTDFIFATLAEELGFLGSSVVLLLFLILLTRLLIIARQAPDQYSCLLTAGIATMILLQLFINVGMNIGVLPVTGITLPFISFGGSSLVAMIISLGLVEAVARRRREMVRQFD